MSEGSECELMQICKTLDWELDSQKIDSEKNTSDLIKK
jgi:hypothetical protein